MKFALQDGWREISPYLDEVLDLEADVRQEWLRELATREPVIAERLRLYLTDLDELDEQNFLGTPPLVGQASFAGQRFGAYTLDREIGHGGTGTVWLAHRSDGRFEGQVAVKLLGAAFVAHPTAQRFAREASLLARLRHPNIAHLLDAGVEGGGQPYLVLEYVPGEHIDEYCRNASLGIEGRIRLFLEVLEAVSHAHGNLIVHRDLKPSNILVTPDGAVKLLDFGIAAMLSPASNGSGVPLTQNRPVGMTPGYASPEQLRGEPVTTATDVYALGMVLFVMLVDRHPFVSEACNTAEMMRLILDTDAPRASDLTANVAHRRQLRGDLDNIIALALRRDPAERYSSVEQFAQDLRRYLALEPVSARPRSLGYLTRMFVRRHSVVVTAAAAIVAVLVVAVILTSKQMMEARQQRDRALFQTRRAEATSEFLELLMLSDLGPGQPMRTLPERLEAGVKMLNQQYGGDPKFAGRMLVELGENFRYLHDTGRANELFQQAYDIGRKQQDAELMAEAQCTHVYADGYADIQQGSAARLAEAKRLLSQVAQPEPDIRVICLLAEAQLDRRSGHIDTAEAKLNQALRSMEASGDAQRQTYGAILTDLGQLYLDRNQPREVLRIATLVGEFQDRIGRGNTAERLTARQNAATALGAMGETRAALAEREIINGRLLELDSAPEQSLSIWINYASVLLRMARPAAALETLNDVMDRARRVGNPYMLVTALYQKGAALVQLGRFEEADSTLAEAASLAAGRNRQTNALIESVMARADLQRGDLQSARRHTDNSLQLAGYHTSKPERALPKMLLLAAEVGLAQHSGESAGGYAREALAIVEPIARGADTSADVGEALLRIVQAQRQGDRTPLAPESKKMVERAVRCLTNGLGSEHPLTLEAQSLLVTP